jgi:hypothetical protein
MDKGTEPVKPVKQEKPRLLVQDLTTSASATCYQRERWVTPVGRTILAPLPELVDCHFGPGRFVLMQYHKGQSTQPRLTALLQSVGVSGEVY